MLLFKSCSGSWMLLYLWFLDVNLNKTFFILFCFIIGRFHIAILHLSSGHGHPNFCLSLTENCLASPQSFWADRLYRVLYVLWGIVCHKVCTPSVDDFSATRFKPHALGTMHPWISSFSSSVICWTPPGKALTPTLREDLMNCKPLTFIHLQWLLTYVIVFKPK